MNRASRARPTFASGAPPLLAAALLAVALAAAGIRPAAGSLAGVGRARSTAPNPFAADPMWDDGRAEVNAYEASENRYGVGRPFTAYQIVVKEDFSRSQLVKADPGHDQKDLVTVLKMNDVLYLQTGIYAYHQMASAFFDRASMELLKFTLTSFEWCGNSFKEYTHRDGRATLHVHTYWDGQAEATYDLPVGPDVALYDQLPLWVRSLPQRLGTERRLRLVSGQIVSKGPKPEIRPATLRAAEEETLATPAGTFRTLRWELRVGTLPPDLFWIGRDPPYLLVGRDKPDGGRYRLKWTQRLAYWQLNHPGDEKYLQGPGALRPE
ncbi:MAG TPA: hypothetical protein VFT43_11220 [Candidatus Polarisedimenticolia bacterium]|nr:hypothetical protein [Candidatus Polarisedimenticolia bacterium]